MFCLMCFSFKFSLVVCFTLIYGATDVSPSSLFSFLSLYEVLRRFSVSKTHTHVTILLVGTTMDTPPAKDRQELRDQICESALITQVKQHPNLYDYSHEEYKDMHKCTQTWRSIARELGFPGQWKVCKERWRTLRDVYVRNRKRYLLEGELALKKQKWRFFNQMSFLHSYINHRALEVEKSAHDNRYVMLTCSLGRH